MIIDKMTLVSVVWLLLFINVVCSEEDLVECMLYKIACLHNSNLTKFPIKAAIKEIEDRFV